MLSFKLELGFLLDYLDPLSTACFQMSPKKVFRYQYNNIYPIVRYQLTWAGYPASTRNPRMKQLFKENN